MLLNEDITEFQSKVQSKGKECQEKIKSVKDVMGRRDEGVSVRRYMSLLCIKYGENCLPTQGGGRESAFGNCPLEIKGLEHFR